MKRKTEYDEKNKRYTIVDPEWRFPSFGELIQWIGYLEDLLEKEKERQDGK